MADSTINYGFPYPTGGDRVAVHSDIENVAKAVDATELQTNLRVDAALAAADAARFDLTGTTLESSSDLDTLPNGVYSVWSGSVATTLGLPTNTLGTLTSTRFGTGAGTQTWQTRALDPQLWIRAELSSGWSEWKRIDAGARQTANLLPASPTQLRQAALSVTTGYGGDSTTGQGWVRGLLHIPAGTVRARLHIRNWNPRYNTADSDAATLSAIHVGPRNGQTSQATQWTEVAATGSTGTGGFQTPWFDFDPGTVGRDWLAAFAWESSEPVQINIGTGWTGTGSDPTAGAGSASDTLPFFIFMEVESEANVPTLAVFGDSISSGVGADRVYGSWLSEYCRARGVLPMHWAHSGDSGPSWEDPEAKKWGLYGTDIHQVDAVMYMMGSNQVFAAATPTLQQMIDTATACVENLRRHVSPLVYGCTILPRTTPTGQAETVRRQFNAWMRSSGLFHDVFDFAAAVSNDDETLRPEFDADGIHLNAAGYAALAAAVTRPVVSERGVTYVGDGVYELA